jgi:tetraacyldisaccharide 4'-kinase
MPVTEVGDEALLLSAFAPVYVARNRAAAARMALDKGAGALILDDGFQNPSVARDLNLLVVDAAAGFGNGRVLPAGPLREPVAAGLRRADALVIIGDEAARARLVSRWPETAGIPRLEAEIRPLATGMDWSGMPVVAFAGIGRPQKFFETLDGLGARVLRRIPLADHQPFGTKLLARIERAAAEVGGQLVTTEKDAARLPPAFRGRVLTLPVRLEWADPAGLDALLARLPTRPAPRR